MAKAPAGTTVEWDAEITKDVPGQLIAWRSVEGADVENSGVVRFDRAPGGRGTEVRVELVYDPPGGLLGAGVAKLFGEEPGQQIKGDLYRFKQVMETGEVVHSDCKHSSRACIRQSLPRRRRKGGVMKANCWMNMKTVEVQEVPDPKILNQRDAIVKITLDGDLRLGPAPL